MRGFVIYTYTYVLCKAVETAPLISKWMQRKEKRCGWTEYLERERKIILLLSCSLISCLPFKWISHLHVCLRPGSNPAYPSHNDQFFLQTTPAETCSVGCHFITFNLHHLYLKLTFRLLYLKNNNTYLCKSVKITVTLLLCSFPQQNSNCLAVLCIALTEVSALFMWFSTKKRRKQLSLLR